MKINRIIGVIIASVLVIAGGSCKKYFDPPLVFEADQGPNLSKDRKVLLLSIDGLSGIELSKYQPEHISKLLENAKYTFEGIADANTLDAPSWTTMLSGKSSNKHGIVAEDFEEEDLGDPDNPDHDGGGASTGFISVYQRLLESGKTLKSLSITPWDPLDHNLFNLSDENGTVTSDEAVRDKAVDRIKNGENDLSFVVVNFRDLNKVGLESGFSMDNADYKAELDKIDGYIGEILEAVAQRNRSASEDWLVIVTSNHGGIDNTYGGASFEERKVPIIYYHPLFLKNEFTMPEVTSAFKAKSGVNGSIPAASAGIYNIGTSGEYTIQLKLMVHQFGGLNLAILSKQGNTGNSDDGWSFIHNGAVGWRLKVKGTQLTSDQKFEAGKWYTLTARIYMDGSTRKAQVFTDGTIGSDGSAGTGQGSSSSNLNVGYSSSYVNGTWIQTVKDLRIYNTALPVEHIKNTYCQTISLDDDIYKTNLIGSWDLGDAIGGELKNNIEGVPNFTLNGSYSWEFMQNDFCKLLTSEEATEGEKILQSIDILPQVFYWLDITTADSWGLEGSVFLDGYETEFIGK